MSQALVYVRSSVIVQFCLDHPVNQERDKRHMADLGGIGDIKLPVPYSESFLRAIHDHHGMITQEDFWKFVQMEPKNQSDILKLTQQEFEGLRVKIFRNFYSPLVDSLHVWALCIENDEFDRCILDSADDACSKTDLTLYKYDICTRISLRTDSPRSRKAAFYKTQVRGGTPPGTKEVWLKIDGKTLLGGKHWYTWTDIRDVLYSKNQAGMFD